MQLRQPEQALTVYVEFHDLVKERADRDQANVGAQRDFAFALQKVGDAQLELGHARKALEQYERSLSLRRNLAEHDAAAPLCSATSPYRWNE